ncbi:MAG: RIFT barrel domain-containing protein [Planctomycetota bacterium]
MDITVRDMTGLKSLRPVTGGVPLAQGAAQEGAYFVLYSQNNKPVLCQTSVLARWKDRSARWVLLDFQAEPPANGTSHFKLSWGKKVKTVNPEFPIRITGREKPSVETRDIVLSPVKDALLRVSDRVDLKLSLTDGKGRSCRAIVESVEVQTRGKVRSTLVVKGAFRSPDRERVLGFRVGVSVFAGLSKVYIEPQILVDSEKGVMQNICDLKFEVIPLNPIRSASIGGAPGYSGKPASSLRLFQVDDENYRLEGAWGKGSKAPGWAQIDDGKGTIAIALKDFWQQWPKSIEADSKGLRIGLFPEFEEGAFDHMKPWYKYQYLFEGNCYRLRTGQAPRWRLWLDFSGDGNSLAKSANAPLVPSAEPAEAIAAGVWGYIAAAGSPGMKEYDDWAENLFDNGYVHSIKAQRDYGQMNWGDWFGERQCNWGNHEYDTPKHVFKQFARTGDPKYFYLANDAARHTSEVDVVQFINDDLKKHFEDFSGLRKEYPIRPGMVHEHCVGHVSGFYSVEKIRELYVSFGTGRSETPYLCLDPYNLGHIFTQGMAYNYFLTGDPWMKETVEKIGKNLAQLVEDREYNFKVGSHVGRRNGWTMLAIAGAYELDFDQRYLNAMKLLADDAISAQDPHCGGWLWKLPWGHCYCETKHVGEAGFIGSVRMNGLSRYYEFSGDQRIAEVIKRGVTHLNNGTWIEQNSGWRYTSCPASDCYAGQ